MMVLVFVLGIGGVWLVVVVCVSKWSWCLVLMFVIVVVFFVVGICSVVLMCSWLMFLLMKVCGLFW